MTPADIVSVRWNQREWSVVDVLGQWLEGGRRYARVKAVSGGTPAIFDLVKLENGSWKLAGLEVIDGRP